MRALLSISLIFQNLARAGVALFASLSLQPAESIAARNHWNQARPPLLFRIRMSGLIDLREQLIARTGLISFVLPCEWNSGNPS